MKIRKSGTSTAPMTKFQQADQMDAKSIRAFVNDPKSWNPLYLYHAPRVLTFVEAVLSAQDFKLSTFDQSKAVLKQCQGSDFTVYVIVTNGSWVHRGAWVCLSQRRADRWFLVTNPCAEREDRVRYITQLQRPPSTSPLMAWDAVILLVATVGIPLSSD